MSGWFNSSDSSPLRPLNVTAHGLDDELKHHSSTVNRKSNYRKKILQSEQQ
ncbi:hypothetical protein VB773_15610 [Haloarculaceae archaeon H-GB2-1]|nr:hypothetical protein [Haloarculaceae archaeon H-GB1-1]MEA5408853.1 hypothetical protein [Haloarculaceae archaeon H-GB2-1]